MHVSKIALSALLAVSGVVAAQAIRSAHVAPAPSALPQFPQDVAIESRKTAAPPPVTAPMPERNDDAGVVPVVVHRSEARTLREKIDVLVLAGKIGQARGQAELFFARFPDDPEAARIESLTGVHPRPGLFGRRTGKPSSAGESK